MSVRYALAARGTFVICEYDATEGREDLDEISRKVLGKIPRTGAVRSYVFGTHTFNYLVEKDMIFLCTAATGASTELVFQFLRELSRSFAQAQSAGKDRGELTRLIKGLMEHYNSDKGATKVQKMERDLEDVTEMMRDNVGKVLERGEQIESLIDKTSSLGMETTRFRGQARSHNTEMWWRDVQTRLILWLLLGCLVFFLLWRSYLRSDA